MGNRWFYIIFISTRRNPFSYHKTILPQSFRIYQTNIIQKEFLPQLTSIP